MKQLKLLKWTYVQGFGMLVRTESMFAITNQAFLAMVLIKTYSHISMTLLKTWNTVICIKYQWAALIMI